MEIVLLKILGMVVLFIVMTSCGMIPVVAVWKSKSTNFSEITSTLISVCNCLAGGVFMGMCFLGLFPYVREKFDEIFVSANFKISFPLSEFVVLLGFFIFLAVEQSLLVFCGKNDIGEVNTKDISLKMSEMEESDFIENIRKSEDESRIRLLESETTDTDFCFDSKSKEDNSNSVMSTGHQAVVANKSFTRSQRSVNFNVNKKYLGFGGHDHCDIVYKFQKDSTLKNLIFLFAISIHSLFEGMTLGLQTDTMKILHLFLAVLIHESLVAFALGVNVSKFHFGMMESLKYILLVTGSIPVGILLGILCGTAPGLYGKIGSGLLQGLAAGIFIHVTFMEIIPEEFLSEKNRLYKVLFFFIGFMCMAIVNFSLGDHH